MKRGSVEVWWIIIGAVIALVVLMVILFIFTNKTGSVAGGLSGCESKGGICVQGGTCPKNTLSAFFECPPSLTCCLGSPQTYSGECTGKIISVSGTQQKEWCS